MAKTNLKKYENFLLKKYHNDIDSSMVIELSEYKSICDIVKLLQNDTDLKMQMLVSIHAIDYPSRKKRFEVIYNMLSLTNNNRMLIKINVADQEIVPSISGIFESAKWYEREIWDMYGIIFSGNSDMRRILTDYGFVGHPMRKDFPLTGYTEVCCENNTKGVIYKDVDLPQDFRSFDFSSPWEGQNQNTLHGDEKATTE